MSGERALVDTNVLVYAIDSTDPRKTQAAVALLDEAAKSANAFAVTEQNLRECAAVLCRKKRFPAQKFQETLAALLAAFRGTLRDAPEDWLEAFVLARAHTAPYWDALLVATMKRNGIHAILTEDEQDFKKFPSLKVINPFK